MIFDLWSAKMKSARNVNKLLHGHVQCFFCKRHFATMWYSQESSFLSVSFEFNFLDFILYFSQRWFESDCYCCSFLILSFTLYLFDTFNVYAKYNNYIFRNCKHFLIASSKSPPATTSPIEDGKVSFLFNYLEAVFEQISLWTPLWIRWMKFLLKINFVRSSQKFRPILYGRFH